MQVWRLFAYFGTFQLEEGIVNIYVCVSLS